VPTPFPGVLAMGAAVVVLFFLPWIDRNPVKSVRYRSPLHKLNLLVFVVSFIALGYLGTKPPSPMLAELAARLSELYFLFFFVLWIHSRPRSVVYSLTWFIALVTAVTLYDYSRYSEETLTLVMITWTIPVVYLIVMILLPLVTPWGQDRAVPERLNAVGT
jgi:ubiquinol-cytochrome c reductase cytochrome b subunit